jgi:hypothetical protein
LQQNAALKEGHLDETPLVHSLLIEYISFNNVPENNVPVHKSLQSTHSA